MPCSQSQFTTSYLAVSSQTCSAVSHNCLCDTTTCQTRLDLMLHKMKLGLLGHTILDLVSSIEHVLVNLLNLKFQQCKCTEQAQTIVRTIIEILQCTHTYIPYILGVPKVSFHFVMVVCCASHASPIIKWSIYFFSWIKIDAKNGITLKN